MNRVTAIGLASLVAYGLLIASKYAGIVSAHEEKPSQASGVSDEAALRAFVGEPQGTPAPATVSLPPPLQHPERMRLTPASLDFRAAKDLKAYADNMSAHRGSLSGDERYNLARALEECQFTTNINEDLAAYSAKQRRQFIANLNPSDPNAARRIAAYDASDNTQRCLHFQGTRISQKDIEDLYNAAAQQGDARAQARLLVAELNAKISANSKNDAATPPAAVTGDDMSRIISLLESRDPEAMLIVGNLLAQSAIASQLHIGPNGEVPEPSALIGAFSLVACDESSDCTQLTRDPQLACAYSGYCDATTFEELYQNFMASPWAYAQATRYRTIIHTAIDSHNWSLIGLVPKRAAAVQ